MKTLLNYDFEFVQNIEPVLNKDNTIKEFSPQDSYNNIKNHALNSHGSGSFCKFSIHPKWSKVSGVYAFFIDDQLVYIGQCLDFAQRFNQGYGSISARCCFEGGQSTNCKMNKLVLAAKKANQEVALYFHMTHDYNTVEYALIKHYSPPYNAQLTSPRTTNKPVAKKIKSSTITSATKARKSTQNPSTDEVREHIRTLLRNAKETGLSSLELRSGDIHKDLNMDRAMPTVCSAMRTPGLGFKFEEIAAPPKGYGANLYIKYYF